MHTFRRKDCYVLLTRNSCNCQHKILCAAKKINSIVDASKYENLCKKFEDLKMIEHDKYVKNIDLNSESNPQFWKFVKGEFESIILPCKVIYENKTTVYDSDKAYNFAKPL